MAEAESKTIEDFGDQWSAYKSNEGFYGSLEMFADIIAPLMTVEDFRGKLVVDVGSGAGRIVNMLIAAGAAHVHAVEPSPKAYATLLENTAAHADRITFLNASGRELLPVSADCLVSIGVIHHIRHPDPVMKACLQALRPGGKCLIWLYGREGNALYLLPIVPLRFLTTRMPHVMLAAFSSLLNVALSAYVALCRYLPLPMRAYMRRVIAPLSPQARRLVIYDQLNPQYAKYYSRGEAIDLMRRAGFTDIRVHHRHGYSWSVLGTRPPL